MIKNILDDIIYIEPRTDLPIPDDMCKDCDPETLSTVKHENFIENELLIQLHKK